MFDAGSVSAVPLPPLCVIDSSFYRLIRYARSYVWKIDNTKFVFNCDFASGLVDPFIGLFFRELFQRFTNVIVRTTLKLIYYPSDVAFYYYYYYFVKKSIRLCLSRRLILFFFHLMLYTGLASITKRIFRIVLPGGAVRWYFRST